MFKHLFALALFASLYAFTVGCAGESGSTVIEGEPRELTEEEMYPSDSELGAPE